MNGPLSIDDTIKLRSYLDTLLEIAVDNLKRHPLPENDSSYFRGRISTLEQLLLWIEPKPAPKPEEVIDSPPGNY